MCLKTLFLFSIHFCILKISKKIIYYRSLFNDNSSKSDKPDSSDNSDDFDNSDESDSSSEFDNSDESDNSLESDSESTNCMSVSSDSDEQDSAENSAIEENVNEELERLFFGKYKFYIYLFYSINSSDALVIKF